MFFRRLHNLELIINGKSFSIAENMKKSLAKAIALSNREICLEIYMQDEEDREYDAIIFLDAITGESEITYIKYIKKAINEPFYNFKKLFIPNAIIKASCIDVHFVTNAEMLDMFPDVNLVEPVFYPKDSTLFVYLPSMKTIPKNNTRTAEQNFLNAIPIAKATAITRSSLSTINKTASPEAPEASQKAEPPVARESIYTKKFSAQERREALKKYLEIKDGIDIFYVPLMTKILRLDRKTGAVKYHDIDNLINNPQLGLGGVDDLMSLGLFKTSIKGKFKNVSCCDIRHAYKYFENKESPIKEINYVINNDTLYLIYANPSDVSRNISLKELSRITYTNYAKNSEHLLNLLENYFVLSFYVYRNTLPDCIALCNEKDDTVSFLELNDIAKIMENFSYEVNTDISVLFPIDRIIDLNEYGDETVKNIRHGSLKALNACDIKSIREDDGDISVGFDAKNKIVFYSRPRY